MGTPFREMFYVPHPHRGEGQEEVRDAHDNENDHDKEGQEGEEEEEEEEVVVRRRRRRKSSGESKMASATPNRSDTLKSAVSTLTEFNTPPESPTSKSMASSTSSGATPEPASLVFAPDVSPASSSSSKPPIPPPRVKKLAASKKLEKLKIGHIHVPPIGGGGGAAGGGVISPLARSSSQGDESPKCQLPVHPQGKSVSSDALVPSDLLLQQQQLQQPHQLPQLKGHLSMLVVSAKGLRQMMKVRWFCYDRKLGRLRYYRDENEQEMLGEVDITSATFCYDVQSDRNGEFTIWSVVGSDCTFFSPITTYLVYRPASFSFIIGLSDLHPILPTFYLVAA